MSAIQSILNRSRDIRLLCSRLTNLHVAKNITQKTFLCPQNVNQMGMLSAAFHSSSPRYDLLEFFDDKKNWGESEVRAGRSWRLDELRIKSNSDLHKLWYVLLKEKNMLLTMEHECEEKCEIFPNPERVDKVKESMANIETVVRERNRAYHLLETGSDGERAVVEEIDRLGMPSQYQVSEHFIPKEYNKKWQEKRAFNLEHRNDRDVKVFLRFHREKQNKMARRQQSRDKNHVTKLLSRYPDLDRNLLKREYPDVDVDDIDKKDKARGHYVPRVD